jgi:hypothetical protein
VVDELADRKWSISSQTLRVAREYDTADDGHHQITTELDIQFNSVQFILFQKSVFSDTSSTCRMM